MNDLTEKLIAALVIIPVLLAIFRGWKEMTIIAAAIGISLRSNWCQSLVSELKSPHHVL